MSAISGIGMPQYHQYMSQSQAIRATNSTSEEANESPAEKAAEAKSQPATHVLDRYA